MKTNDKETGKLCNYMFSYLPMIIFFFFLLNCPFVFSQAPEKISYQAVIRNSNNQLVTNQAVSVHVSILQGTLTGSPVYTETHIKNTNANGLVTLEIGDGVTSDDFSAIDWANGPYFIHTETDPAGGTNYTITGTSQILSVPYALHAKTAETLTGGGGITENDPVFLSSQAANITSEDIIKLSNLSGTNTGDQDLSGYATIIALDAKVDKVDGMGLSSNDYTTAEKTKLAGITEGTNVNVNADWNADSGDAQILNKPTTLAGYGITDAVSVSGNQNIGGNKSFTGAITVPAPVNPNDAVTKAYVDALKELIYSEIMLDLGMNGQLTDIDGNVYNTIKINDQVWMAENLKTSRYADGTPIPFIDSVSAWAGLSVNDRAYCWYDDDSVTNAQSYGALYTWAAAMNGAASSTSSPSMVQGACPDGWHLPSNNEWAALISFLGGNLEAGGRLKETDMTHWLFPNEGATNESGFTARPSGNRNTDGTFGYITRFGSFWAATELDETQAGCRIMGYNGTFVYIDNFAKTNGLAVRCLRD